MAIALHSYYNYATTTTTEEPGSPYYNTRTRSFNYDSEQVVQLQQKKGPTLPFTGEATSLVLVLAGVVILSGTVV